MLKIHYNYKIKMLYNEGNTEIIKERPLLSSVEYIAEMYQQNEKEDCKYYWIYIEIIVKFLGIKVAKRTICLKEWGQYDEF